MKKTILVIARKEIVDGLRDARAVMASLVYALMGPVVVGLVSLSVHSGKVTAAMMAVFTLVSAFVGGMSVAMDTIAGERERHCLLPLLLNPVDRRSVAIGKWLAVSFFAVAGLAVNVSGCLAVVTLTGMRTTSPDLGMVLSAAFALSALGLLAAAVQLVISTLTNAVKEAQTYLSLVVFLPMGVGMFLIFSPAANGPWSVLLPMAGQLLQVQALMNGTPFQWLAAFVSGVLTVGVAILMLMVAADRLEHHEIHYWS
jgi:sodium transport system permease protein